MSLMYNHLPTKFDYTQHYLNQAAGGPSFPVFRARQRGGSFLSPFIARHGIPLLKWLGKQAATLATGFGSAYLDKGKISKEDMKHMLKKQGKEVAHSVLDRIKQQVGSGGSMTHRRDARLAALVPMATDAMDGLLTNQHRLRPPPGGGMRATKKKKRKKRTATAAAKPKKRAKKAKRTKKKTAARKPRKKVSRKPKSLPKTIFS